MKQQTIAMPGTGVVGIALAKGFIGRGDCVILGGRDLAGDKTRAAQAAAAGATAASHRVVIDASDPLEFRAGKRGRLMIRFATAISALGAALAMNGASGEPCYGRSADFPCPKAARAKPEARAAHGGNPKTSAKDEARKPTEGTGASGGGSPSSDSSGCRRPAPAQEPPEP